MTGYTPDQGRGDGRYNSKGLELGQRRMSLGMKIGIGVARSRKSILYDTAKFG